MPASQTHNEITLRPPPGTRFTIWGQDCKLQFERGREREVIAWLRNWLDTYIEPEAVRHELKMKRAEDERILAQQEAFANVNPFVPPELPEVRRPKGHDRSGPGGFTPEMYEPKKEEIELATDLPLIPPMIPPPNHVVETAERAQAQDLPIGFQEKAYTTPPVAVTGPKPGEANSVIDGAHRAKGSGMATGFVPEMFAPPPVTEESHEKDGA